MTIIIAILAGLIGACGFYVEAYLATGDPRSGAVAVALGLWSAALPCLKIAYEVRK